MAYVSIDYSTIDGDLSDSAYRLLCRIRKDCHDRDTDGWIEDRSLRALNAYHNIGPTKGVRLLRELREKGYLIPGAGGWQDSGYLQTMPSTAKREADRERWRRQKFGQRKGADPNPQPESPPMDTTPESTPDARRESSAESAGMNGERLEMNGETLATETDVSGKGTLHDATFVAGQGSPTTPPSRVYPREGNGNSEDLKPESVKVLRDIEDAGEPIPEPWVPRWSAWKEAQLRGEA
ncbi:hypothetical protein [Candidatus Nephthysia bennettiae]|uniref:Uncharacterized protein n=1 Tax=Candidatus Nephthysia bennettiae TaxID=3127016 RepID=A0A934K8V1_9BACT|nr:hypothetical protein [Candidatus Dormibacteraeota bacterium]MBJ7611918.1 hypothetical protein [Candidatus Dormibacteraeota bacterium]